MDYHTYLQTDFLRITHQQHKRIREIVGFENTDDVNPFTSEPIDLFQAVSIAEYLVGQIHNNWIDNVFKKFGYKTKPLISLSMFMTFLIHDFKIGVKTPGKLPSNL
jgi:hypothetical protein